MKLNTLRLLLLSLAAASLVSCGTPSDDQPADGGSGGSSVQGTAGTQGSGGATAGTGGSSGGGGGAGSVGAGHGGASAGGTVGTGGGTGGEVGGANGGSAASGRGGATAGTSGTAGASGRGGTSGMAGTTGAAGAAGTGGGGRGGASGTGGSPIGGNGGAGATGGAGLPQLTVNGTKLQDPSGKTIILRGSSLIDIGALYYYAGQNISGITTRMDKVAAAGVQGHVVRLPVYPKIDYNGGFADLLALSLPGGDGPDRELHADNAGLRVRLCRQDPQAGGRLRDQQEPVRDHRFSSNRQRHHGQLGG